MAWYFYIGLIAAICIAAFSMPQLIYTIKTKNTSGVSLWMFVLLAFGDFCFVIQGIGMLAVHDLSGGLPLFLANIISCTIAVIVLAFKVRNMLWAKKFNITEKEFCENYATYKTKIKMARAEKIKAKATEAEKPVEAAPEQPKEPATPAPTSGNTAQIIE